MESVGNSISPSIQRPHRNVKRPNYNDGKSSDICLSEDDDLRDPKYRANDLSEDSESDCENVYVPRKKRGKNEDNVAGKSVNVLQSMPK